MSIYMRAFHGGKFWKAIGEKFENLLKADDVISADVLDAWFDPSPEIVTKIKNNLPFLIKTSPPTNSEGLISAIALSRGLSEENILVASGSSEIMFKLFPQIINPSDKVVILDPMYGEYAHIFDEITPASLIRYKLNKESDFNIDKDNFIAFINKEIPQFVVLVNPNNPTGKYFDRNSLLKIVDSFGETIFIIDESYIEYVGKENSLEKEVATRKNLLIIKSMSKSYALSGLRVGYGVFPKEVANKVSAMIPPWAVNSIAQMAAIISLQNNSYYDQKYKETHTLREEMIHKIQRLNKEIKIYSSVSNFILIEFLNSKYKLDEIIYALEKVNVFVRNCDSMSVQFQQNFIRVAVKNKESNEKIISAIAKVL